MLLMLLLPFTLLTVGEGSSDCRLQLGAADLIIIAACIKSHLTLSSLCLASNNLRGFVRLDGNHLLRGPSGMARLTFSFSVYVGGLTLWHGCPALSTPLCWWLCIYCRHSLTGRTATGRIDSFMRTAAKRIAQCRSLPRGRIRLYMFL
jgi:hypothetical protein